LVVIAIIGILVALLLPAIQAARAAARRTQCQSNIKQVGIALHNYHATNKEFPVGMQFDVLNQAHNSINYRPNWIMHILPYLEEQPLYDSFHPDTFDLTKKIYVSNIANREERGTTIPMLLCPEDQGATVPFGGYYVLSSCCSYRAWVAGHLDSQPHPHRNKRTLQRRLKL
jgi:type II secretory pathway pseudopilin PulG